MIAERVKISKLKELNLNFLYVQGGNANREDYPQSLASEIVIPSKMNEFNKHRFLRYLYFWAFLVISSIRLRKNHRVLNVFKGPELVIPGLILKIVFHIPFISYMTDSWLSIRKENVLESEFFFETVRAFERLGMFSDFVIYNNITEVKTLKKKGYPAQKILFDRHGWQRIPVAKSDDLEKIREKVRNKIAMSKGEKLIAFHGTMHFRHNLESFKLIRDVIAPAFLIKEPLVKFLIIGETNGAMFDNNPPSNLILTDFLESKEDLWEYLMASDIYISPTLTGTGIKTKVIEAICCGLPIIATRLVTEAFVEDGIPILTRDLEEFSSTILELLGNPDIMERMREMALEYAEKNFYAESYNNLLKQIFRFRDS